jgi:hypothetical protein
VSDSASAPAPYPRPDPQTERDAAVWEGVEHGELRIQRCTACGTFRHPPRPVCAACGSRDAEPAKVAGTGEVWSFTVVHPPTLPAFAERTPYAAVVVRLDEGAFLVSNLVDCANDEVAVGMRVELAITEVEPGLKLPLFRPA